MLPPFKWLLLQRIVIVLMKYTEMWQFAAKTHRQLQAAKCKRKVENANSEQLVVINKSYCIIPPPWQLCQHINYIIAAIILFFILRTLMQEHTQAHTGTHMAAL